MKINTAGLIEILKDMIARIEVGDSFEGSVGYTCMDDHLMDGEWEVAGGYRIGNSEGQGGMRIMEATP